MKRSMDQYQIGVSEIEEIPTIGLFCYCTNTEGNRFGILQSYPRN
jgi:predicted enzyme related to lactoylglutathione lyase